MEKMKEDPQMEFMGHKVWQARSKNGDYMDVQSNMPRENTTFNVDSLKKKTSDMAAEKEL
jgi:hypothetical protein